METRGPLRRFWIVYSHAVEKGVDGHAQRCERSHGRFEILGFDGGYDAVLGERGVTLSGGQRQRLAIARALAKEAPILVLDDSLSAVDAETEERILGALTSDRNQRTRILIAHRISTLRGADEILVLDRGRVVERGDHESLLAAGGAYARLVRMQGLEHGEPAAVEASARRSS